MQRIGIATVNLTQYGAQRWWKRVMNSVTYDRVSVLYDDKKTLDGVADIKRIDIYKYSGSQDTFRPHYFVIALTGFGTTHPKMLQLLPLGNNSFETIALGEEETPFKELKAEAIRLLTSRKLLDFAKPQPASTDLGVGLFLKP